jgi:probable O-glycosylation ligase (exosortase A-associated)
MRDIIITLIVFAALPIVLIRPHIGILMWSWLGYMNPHRLAYGFAYSFPFAAVVGAVTLVGFFVAREPKRLPWTPTTVILLLFVLWMTVTTLFAVLPTEAWPQWEKVMKIQVMVFLTLLLMAKKERINALVWVIVGSIGFYAIKGGLFVIKTGGEYRVMGPEGSFIGENNSLAFALVMIFPLMRYLQLQAVNKWVKRSLGGAMLLAAFAILSSYSRGAFLALAVVVAFILFKSRKRVLIGITLLVSAPILWNFMPDKWVDRIDTIQTYEQDRSAMGRIYVWKLAARIASEHPVVGGGFGTFHTHYFHELYGSEVTGGLDTYIATDAHSVYFKVLGDHGYVGLILFLLLWLTAYRTGTWLRRHCRDLEDYRWAHDLATMSQVSLIGYAVGGVFIGLSYFDLYYHIIAILILLRFIVGNELRNEPQQVQQDALMGEEPKQSIHLQ